MRKQKASGDGKCAGAVCFGLIANIGSRRFVHKNANLPE
jgi:hypothetical protein